MAAEGAQRITPGIIPAGHRHEIDMDHDFAQTYSRSHPSNSCRWVARTAVTSITAACQRSLHAK
jgi:hypothetical protein